MLYKSNYIKEMNKEIEKVLILINPNRIIYISNGDCDDPHEPPQRELEGCDISQNTLYSHQTKKYSE